MSERELNLRKLATLLGAVSLLAVSVGAQSTPTTTASAQKGAVMQKGTSSAKTIKTISKHAKTSKAHKGGKKSKKSAAPSTPPPPK